jgi:hypothetical protein
LPAFADKARMSDISSSSTLQLTQALSQLTKLAPQSTVAKLGVEVIVKHLSGNLIGLSLPGPARGRNIELPKTQLQGQLQSNQSYSLKFSPQQPPVLQFFSSSQKPEQLTIALSEAQLQALLKLPANQLSKALAIASQSTGAEGSSLKPLLVNAKVESLVNNQLLLKLSGQAQPLYLKVPVGTQLPFKAGDNIQLALSAKGQIWQAQLTKVAAQGANNHAVHVKISSAAQAGSKLSSPHKPSLDGTGANSTKQTVAGQTVAGQTTTINVPKAPLLIIPAEQAGSVLKALLSQTPSTSKASQVVSLPLDTVIRQLQSKALPDVEALLSKLSQVSSEKLGLHSAGNGKFELLAESPRVTGQLAVTKEILAALAPLKLPLQQLISKLLLENTPLDTVREGKAQRNAKLTAPSAPVDVSNSFVPQQPILAEQLAKLTPELKAGSLKLIHSLLRVVQAKAELPAETLQKIDRAISDPQLSKDHPLKEFIDTIGQQIKQALPQGKEQDASQIRQLLNSPALNVSAALLVAPPASQGLLGGLVALIQISLASRLLRNQPGQQERLSQVLGPIITGATKGPAPPQAARGLADFFQLEQKHQLLREIGRLLSGHQASKLGNAEQAIQGQDSFYYTLPSAFGDKVKDIELLIRREQQSSEKKSADATQAKSWHLTMKLSVGEVGELLTKARLRPDHLEVDFYASNEETRNQVLNFLPLFNKRLQELGIEVAKSQCQLGKIPETLQQRPYHVFEAKA